MGNSLPHLCQELVQPPGILSQEPGTQVAMALYLALALEDLSRADYWCSENSLAQSRVILQRQKQIKSKVLRCPLIRPGGCFFVASVDSWQMSLYLTF